MIDCGRAKYSKIEEFFGEEWKERKKNDLIMRTYHSKLMGFMVDEFVYLVNFFFYFFFFVSRKIFDEKRPQTEKIRKVYHDVCYVLLKNNHFPSRVTCWMGVSSSSEKCLSNLLNFSLVFFFIGRSFCSAIWNIWFLAT